MTEQQANTTKAKFFRTVLEQYERWLDNQPDRNEAIEVFATLGEWANSVDVGFAESHLDRFGYEWGHIPDWDWWRDLPTAPLASKDRYTLTDKGKDFLLQLKVTDNVTIEDRSR